MKIWCALVGIAAVQAVGVVELVEDVSSHAGEYLGYVQTASSALPQELVELVVQAYTYSDEGYTLLVGGVYDQQVLEAVATVVPWSTRLFKEPVSSAVAPSSSAAPSSAAVSSSTAALSSAEHASSSAHAAESVTSRDATTTLETQPTVEAQSATAETLATPDPSAATPAPSAATSATLLLFEGEALAMSLMPIVPLVLFVLMMS